MDKRKILKISGIILLFLFLIITWLVFTRSGRRVIYKIAGGIIYQGLDKGEDLEENPVIIPFEKETKKEEKNNTTKTEDTENNEANNQEEKIDDLPKILPEPRQEDYVSNYLLFGLEEILDAQNTDTIMIASINKKDNTIKLTSILRDTYIESEEYRSHKINSIFALGGAKAFVKVIEEKFRINIDGYAYINFDSFEKIIDYLGGISMELGDEEAEYLNTTNYISNPANRTVTPGWNELNGNQALGYCRIRLVKTLGGANDDYGRT